MTLYLKWSQKYDRSKLKVLLLLSEFMSFNFDLSFFEAPIGTGSYSTSLESSQIL